MTTTIPTPAALTQEAEARGYSLSFEYEDQRPERVWVGHGDEEVAEDVIVREYQAYGKDLPYGIWAKISEEPDKLAHRFYVVHAEDGTETDRKGYDDLYDALRWMGRLIGSDSK